MHLEVIFSTKTLPAVITFKFLNFKVLVLSMHFKIILLSETYRAQVTLVWLLSGVDPQVIEELCHTFLCVLAALMLALK